MKIPNLLNSKAAALKPNNALLGNDACQKNTQDIPGKSLHTKPSLRTKMLARTHKR